jgi:hypothetical protein
VSPTQSGHDLDSDSRWRRLNHGPWSCRACGEQHHGVFDLACGKPEPWPGSEEKEPNSALELSGNFLSEDFCVLEGQHFFVRAVLRLPIIGSGGEHFGFGVWSTMSRTNFERYIETFDSGEQEVLGPCFGWFSNRLKGYSETLNLKCQVHPVSDRQRPHIELEGSPHPLAIEQRLGITLDRLLELYTINGHDIRSSLVD